MLKNRRTFVVIAAGLLLALGVTAYCINQSIADKNITQTSLYTKTLDPDFIAKKQKALIQKMLDPEFATKRQQYDKLKAEWQQESDDLLRTSGEEKTLEEIEKRYQRGLALKEKSHVIAELALEVDPLTPEEEFEKKINAIKCALDILKKNHPEAQAKIEQELQKINEMEQDYKDNKKPVEELLHELEKLNKEKIISRKTNINPATSKGMLDLSILSFIHVNDPFP